MLEAAIQEWTTSSTTDIRKHGQRKTDDTNASAFLNNQPPDETPTTSENKKAHSNKIRTSPKKFTCWDCLRSSGQPVVSLAGCVCLEKIDVTPGQK